MQPGNLPKRLAEDPLGVGQVVFIGVVVVMVGVVRTIIILT